MNLLKFWTGNLSKLAAFQWEYLLKKFKVSLIMKAGFRIRFDCLAKNSLEFNNFSLLPTIIIFFYF